VHHRNLSTCFTASMLWNPLGMSMLQHLVPFVDRETLPSADYMLDRFTCYFWSAKRLVYRVDINTTLCRDTDFTKL